MSLPRHEESFRIRCSEADERGEATLPALLDLFQEAAWNHARSYHLSVPELREDGIMWVLFRLHVEIDRYPAWGEAVVVQTWPSGIHGLRFHRDFLYRDAGGSIIGRGTTAFMMLDMASRRPTRLTDERVGFPVTPERAIDDAFPRLPEATAHDRIAEFRVRRDDVDMNRHVNTTSYVRWCLESVPEELWRTRVPAGLEIHYREECFLGDTISAGAQLQEGDPPRCLHTVERRAPDGATGTAAIAVSRWRARPAPFSSTTDSGS